jgi:CheY-specific phosphatase CheX
MGIQFFGEFLISKKVVTRDVLWKAVQLQRKTNLLFGETARSLGMITHEEVERVQEAQRKQDLDFGNMCIKMGILSKEQVRQVTEHQKRNHLLLGDALIRINAVQESVMQALREEFEAEQAAYFAKEAPPRAKLPHEDLWELVAERTYLMFTRFVKLTFKPDQRSVVTGIDPNDMVVAMRLRGDVPCVYLLSLSADMRDAIARGMLKQNDISTQPGEVIVDAVKEFVNIVCGSIVSKVSSMGKKMSFEHAEILDVQERFSPWANGEGLLFPLHVTEGRVEVAIFCEI